MKTPEILLPALRQYQHNDCSGMIAGFDYDETSRIVNLLEKIIKTQLLGGVTMRKCTARAWVKPKPGENGKWVEIAGVFHQFGQQFEEFENGGCTYSTAIVEDIEGQVWEAEVSSVKFLESV